MELEQNFRNKYRNTVVGEIAKFRAQSKERYTYWSIGCNIENCDCRKNRREIILIDFGCKNLIGR